MSIENPSSEDKSRREFLRKAGRFAAVTPPAITLLLGTSLSTRAIAGSSGSVPGGAAPGGSKPNVSKPSGSKPGWGWGDKNHDHSGPPGKH